MRRLLERPGRVLALLEALSFWPLWMGLVLGFVLTPAGADPILSLVGLTASLTGLCAWVGLSPAFLPSHAERGHGFWGGHAIFALLLVVLGIRWLDWQDLVVLTGASFAFSAAVLTGLLARAVSRLPTGTVRIVDGRARLETSHAVYLIGELPRGCGEGDTLTLLGVRHARSEGAGPYRASGRDAAHATRSWKVDAHELAATLRARALGLLAWGMASAIWAMV
ncbi:MAG: hypothetical protein H6722_21550 [Sandaracinus sp.]|nr:hypothetical protein [Myxococcales bacterium]MCB9615031.1 hypothetical protein [Sandaracinus sp.]MCB9622004.1 hypothetical protein [Sandaracinus sp.]